MFLTVSHENAADHNENKWAILSFTSFFYFNDLLDMMPPLLGLGKYSLNKRSVTKIEIVYRLEIHISKRLSIYGENAF